ncbi:fibronectin type III domain-containing protein [Horticoccus sp. 23ND18S-11]|uniref:hypothetical protein n=1 Tax=Horticoccus sp. 23ND18S-11 TaxID=3391832 RepID=UPI0039C8C7A8
MIKLTWTIGRDATSYEVWRSTTNTTGSASKIADVIGNVYEDATAAEGTTYYYWLKTVNPAGTSGFSASTGGIVGGKKLLPPAGVVASLSTTNSITLDWSAVAGASGYDIYRNTAENFGAATLIGSTTSSLTYSDAPPAAETFYVYWVVAKDGTGNFSLPSHAAGGYAAAATPAVPAGVTAEASETDYEITVDWSAAARAQWYEVWRNTVNNSSTATNIATTGALSYLDGGLGGGVTYYYWIKAVNDTGTSAFSTVASDTTHAPIPAAPANVVATRGVGKVTVTADASAFATSYSVWRNTSNTSGGATQIATGLSTPSYDDTSGVPETDYYYWFKATNGTGTSGFSASDHGAAQIKAPTGVVATDGDWIGDVGVYWSAVTYADSYQVWRNTVNNSSTATMIASGLTALSYDDLTVVRDEDYYYWVKAVKGSTPSPFSASDSGYTAIPTAPSVDATIDLLDRITISWDAISGAGGYFVFYNTVNNFATASLLTITVSPQVSVDHFGTSAGDDYYYWVIATVNSINSDPGGPAVGYIPGPPAAPTDVSATDGAHVGKVVVSWTPNGADSYSVYRNSSNTTTGATLLDSGITSSDFEDLAVPDTGAYYYFVKATNTAGTSGFSSSDFGYALAPSDTSSVVASDSDTTKIQVSWAANSQADSYKVYRHTSNSFGAAAFLGDTAATSFDDTDVVPGTTYWYWVVSLKNLIVSNAGSPDTGIRPFDTPAAPDNVAASTTVVAYIHVSWDPSFGADYFEVYRNTVNNSSTATLVNGAVSGTSWDDTGVTPETTYYYWIKAANYSSGSSGFSAVASGSALQPLRGFSLSGSGALDIEVYSQDVATHGFNFNAFTIADQFQVWQGGTLLFDTGCVTGSNGFLLTLFFVGAVRLVVIPDCASVGGTSSWTITVA